MIDVDDIQSHFCIGDLRFAATQNAEELMIADISASEFGYIAGNDIICAFQVLRFAGNAGFLFQCAKVGAVQYVEAVGLLQVCYQDGFCLAAQTVFTVGENAFLEAGAVVECSDGNRGANTVILRIAGGDFCNLEAA